MRSVLLDVQIQIAARRRGYDAGAHDRLFELFGPVADWGTTLRTLLWTRTTLVVPAFEGSTVVDLDVPCRYDLEVAASRYLDALADGEVPLEFLFSGSVFYTGARRRAADDAAVVGERGGLPLPVRGVEGDDGALLPRHGVGAARQGELRPALGLQVAQRAGHLGRRAGGARAMSDLRTLADAVHVRGLHALAVPRRAR